MRKALSQTIWVNRGLPDPSADGSQPFASLSNAALARQTFIQLTEKPD